MEDFQPSVADYRRQKAPQPEPGRWMKENMKILSIISVGFFILVGSEVQAANPIVAATTLSTTPIPHVSIVINNTTNNFSNLSYTNTMRLGKISNPSSFAIEWTLQDDTTHSATLTIPDALLGMGLYELRFSDDGKTVDGKFQAMPENAGTGEPIGMGMFDSSDPEKKKMFCNY